MKKPIIQALITILLFGATWYTLSKIDWINVLKVNQLANTTEEKLGNLLWDVINKSEKEIKNINIVNPIDSIVNQICKANNIDREQLKIHIVYKEDVNAFALPNGYLVIYSGLILDTDKQEELIGVICHEIAHIELRHVMKKLIKEIGLSVLISITTGNKSAEVIKETVKLLSSSAYDRGLEKEADIKAVDYLIKANINPEPFAEFLYKLSDRDHSATKYLKWVSTHPESKERAEYIIDYSKDFMIDKQTILSIETWDKMKSELMNEY